MSRDWSVWCKDCEKEVVSSAGHDWNHADKQCWDIIAMADALAALEEVSQKTETYITIEMNTFYKFHLGSVAKHRGHRLIPRDEYGQWADNCPKSFKCEAHSSHWCQLPLDHPGPCGPKAKV